MAVSKFQFLYRIKLSILGKFKNDQFNKYCFGRAPIGSGFTLQSFFAKIQGQKKDFRFNPSRLRTLINIVVAFIFLIHVVACYQQSITIKKTEIKKY
jgi:hypothetical protein